MTGFCPSRLGLNPANLFSPGVGLLVNTECEIEWSILFLLPSSFLSSFKHCERINRDLPINTEYKIIIRKEAQLKKKYFTDTLLSVHSKKEGSERG